MQIAFVGCGFVADYYYETLKNHPELKLIGAYDHNPVRLKQFCRHYQVPSYPNLSSLLSDDRIQIVVNLTNPRSHFEISRAALEAGKHVYSEKPLAMSLAEAELLINLAKQQSLRITSAPCNLLSQTAQTLWKAVRKQEIGPIRLVYAEVDDGMIHRMPYRKWHSASGAPWPYRDEFEIGCTLEHAGYYLPWLTAYFGPARQLTAFSTCLIPEKLPQGQTLTPSDTPDFSVGIIKFDSGVVARLTCSIVAPHDHGMLIVGDQGILSVKDGWNNQSPVHLRKFMTIRRKTFLAPWKTSVPPEINHSRTSHTTRGAQTMDFARGIAELANMVTTQQRGALPEDFVLHNTELALALHQARENAGAQCLKTSFAPL